MRAKIVEAIEGSESVIQLLDLRTQHIGPDQLLVAAEVKMNPALDTEGVAVAIDAVEARIRQAVPIAKMIYLEPDIHTHGSGDDEKAAATNR